MKVWSSGIVGIVGVLRTMLLICKELWIVTQVFILVMLLKIKRLGLI